MLTKISLTFGSRQILQSIIDKYPERHFKLMQATTHTRKLALFDLSGKDTIFQSPVKLTTLDSTLDAQLNGLYNTLQKVLTEPADMNGGYMLSVDNKAEATTLVLLTAWADFEALTAWKESETFTSLKNFTSMGSDNSYYDEIYKPIF